MEPMTTTKFKMLKYSSLLSGQKQSVWGFNLDSYQEI